MDLYDSLKESLIEFKNLREKQLNCDKIIHKIKLILIEIYLFDNKISIDEECQLNRINNLCIKLMPELDILQK